MNIAMILAGGTGSRVGEDIPKQFIKVHDKPVLAYTIENFESNINIDYIEIVCHKDWIEYLKDLISKYQYKKVRWIVEGGNDFQHSALNGVKFLENKLNDDDMILIQYGASPLTSEKVINEAINVCQMHGNAVSTFPIYQLLGSNDNDKSLSFVDRDKIIQLTCPQVFLKKNLDMIYKEALEKDLLDTVEPHTTSLMYALNIPIYQSYGEPWNIKITTKEDIELFTRLLSINKEI